MSDQQPKQTPILDLLRDIPADARMVYEVNPTHHQSIPVGVLAHQAADEIERLRADLEREQLRLAACGVVALANTPESAAKARQMHDDYRSASCDDVARAVDREMALRAALVAAMEIVQKERTRIAYNAKGAPPAIYEGYADIMRRLDAVIAQADAAMGREG
jgi:hypothetical protein